MGESRGEVLKLRQVGERLQTVLLVVAFLIVVTTREAHAYIDLGSGSFFIQVLLGTFFASLFTIKVFWRRLTGYMSRFFSRMKRAKGPMKNP